LPQARTKRIKRSSLNFPALLFLGGAVSCAIGCNIGCNRAPAPDVLATVNGKQIMSADVERIYKQSLGDNALQPSKEVAAVQRINILHQMIQDEIMQQRAARLNLVATDEEVDAKLTEMKTPFTQEEFDRQLKEKNLTLEELRREIRREITSRKLINKEIESKINITDAEIGNYYNAHKSEFDLIEPQYHVARIVVTNQPSKQVSSWITARISPPWRSGSLKTRRTAPAAEIWDLFPRPLFEPPIQMSSQPSASLRRANRQTFCPSLAGMGRPARS
jgi:hypothetical protein